MLVVTFWFGRNCISYNAHTDRINQAIAVGKQQICARYHITPEEIHLITVLAQRKGIWKLAETHRRDAAGNLYIERPGKKAKKVGDRPTPKPQLRKTNRGNAPTYYSV